MQWRVWIKCIVTPYQGKCKRCTLAVTRGKHMHCDAIPIKAWETHALWRKSCLNRNTCIVPPIPRKTQKAPKPMQWHVNWYRDALLHVHCDVIPRKTRKAPYPMQWRVWNTCNETPYREKRKRCLNWCRNGRETHALWRNNEEKAKGVLPDVDVRVKHVHCDAIPRKTRKVT